MRLFRLVALSVAACGALAACASNDARRHSKMSPEARLQVAEAADAAGNTELAIAMYTAAADSDPSNIGLQLRCADALARNGKIGEARQFLADRLGRRSGQPDLLRALALVDLVAGQPDQAIAGFNKVLAINPSDVATRVDLAVALDLEGQHAAAQAIYLQVLAANPNDAATRNDLAVSMMLEGRTRQALQTLAPLEDSGAMVPRLKVNLGILYAATGDSERSRQLLGDRASDTEFLALTRALAQPVSGLSPQEASAAR
jgi:Flp pilus assembly protein TadD